MCNIVQISAIVENCLTEQHDRADVQTPILHVLENSMQ